MRTSNVAGPVLAAGILAAFIYSEKVVQPKPVDNKIHVVYWEKWTEFEGDAIRAVVDAYNASQNRIHVDLLTVSGIENKTLLAIAGGTPPDVAGLYGPNVAQYAEDRAIEPLDDYCRANGIKRDNYIPVYWDMGTYRGHQYALPSVPASTALHYSKTMMREAGLDPEKPPKTIEELNQMAEKMTVKGPDGKYDKMGFMPAEPGWWNWGWGYIFGGSLWDGSSKITANSPENIRAYEWVQSWSKRYGATSLDSFKGGLGNFSSPQNGFLSGKVGMELQGVWMYNFINMYAPKMEKPVREWGAVPFPYPADRPDLAESTFADEDCLVIPRGAKHPNEAFDFIKYVQSQKGMELLCMGQRKHSCLKNVSPEFWKNHPNPFVHLFAELASGKNVITPPKIGLWPELHDAMTNAFDQIALEKKTPKEALDEVQAVMQPKLDALLKIQRLRDQQEARTAAVEPPRHQGTKNVAPRGIANQTPTASKALIPADAGRRKAAGQAAVGFQPTAYLLRQSGPRPSGRPTPSSSAAL
jgi:ABC-type glycerol-3-phosphate transport system substrate-binding protein